MGLLDDNWVRRAARGLPIPGWKLRSLLQEEREAIGSALRVVSDFVPTVEAGLPTGLANELEGMDGDVVDLGSAGDAWCEYQIIGGFAVGELKVVFGADADFGVGGQLWLRLPFGLPQDGKLHNFSVVCKLVEGTPDGATDFRFGSSTGGDLSALNGVSPGSIPADAVVIDMPSATPGGPPTAVEDDQPWAWAAGTGGFIHITFTCRVAV